MSDSGGFWPGDEPEDNMGDRQVEVTEPDPDSVG